MRDLERTNGLNRRAQDIIDPTMFLLRFLDGAKNAKNLCAVESLSFTMVTEAHGHLTFTVTAGLRRMGTDKLSQASNTGAGRVAAPWPITALS